MEASFAPASEAYAAARSTAGMPPARIRGHSAQLMRLMQRTVALLSLRLEIQIHSLCRMRSLAGTGRGSSCG